MLICHAMVEAPGLLGVHPTSISYVYKVFQHLCMLWKGIWVCTYSVMPVPVGSGFYENWGRVEPQ